MSNFGINLHYITVATKQHPVLDKIIERVKKQNEQMIILGLKENRQIGWEGTGNFGVKLRETRDFVFNEKIRPQDIVLFTDAYDVVYGGSQIEVLKRFIQQQKPIMFGCESQCHPDKEESSKYPEQKPEFPYLNSGMFIGYAWALRYCLLDYKYNDADDDQRYWTKQYLQYPWLFKLDYENQLFLNTEDMDWDKFTWENATATYKNRNPQFVHVNGPDKTKLDRFT
jgi:hypothetical protein